MKLNADIIKKFILVSVLSYLKSWYQNSKKFVKKKTFLKQAFLNQPLKSLLKKTNKSLTMIRLLFRNAR